MVMVSETLEKAGKIIITGGAGFIGSHIAEELVKYNLHLIILDDLSTGKYENISHLIEKGNVEFILGSINDRSLLVSLFSNADYVFHQAAVASVPESLENPLAYHEVNVTGTLNILLAARDYKVKKVVCASSSAVYGNAPDLPRAEDMSPNPCSPYAVTKLASEIYCDVFRKSYGLPSLCLRYFNVYGPRQSPQSEGAAVIPKFIRAVCQGQPPTIFGDGEQTRDFIYVKDVARANIIAAVSDFSGILNIGTGKSVSLNRLLRLILRLAGQENIQPVFEKERYGDVRHSRADISRAGSVGFLPEYDLEKGLLETIRAFQAAGRSTQVAV